MADKIRPEPCDYAVTDRAYGKLRPDANEAEIAERYRLVQAHALARVCQEDGVLDRSLRQKT